MNGWDNLGEWFDEIVEDELKAAKTQAGDEFLQEVTSPTNHWKDTKHYNSNGNTPVLEGNLMANTEVGVNYAPDGENPYEDEDGKVTYSKGITKVKSAGAWDKIYIVNATEYNIEAEFEGWGKSGPYRYWQLSYNNMLEAIKK
jgi:hypothetical protein